MVVVWCVELVGVLCGVCGDYGVVVVGGVELLLDCVKLVDIMSVV